MIDPVRTGPVSRIVAVPQISADVGREPAAVPRQMATGAQIPRLMELAADLAHLGPPVDYAKIAQVRRAIADGTYKIDANALAKAIMNYGPEQ